MDIRTTDTIIADLKKIIGSRTPLDREKWLEAAFYLSVLRLDEAHKLNISNQKVAARKLEILKAQEKKNVAAAELEVEASEEYRVMKDQEAKIYSVDELIRVAKKNSDTSY